jgi:hypothetical protein
MIASASIKPADGGPPTCGAPAALTRPLRGHAGRVVQLSKSFRTNKINIKLW